MTALESSYRRALRLYPRQWRAQNEDAVLGTLLDTADAEGRTVPNPAETRSLAVNGLLARVDVLAPRRWRDLAAASTLIGTTGFALIHFVFFEWEPWSHYVDPSQASVFFRPFSTPASVVDVIWIAMAILALCSWHRSARVLATVVVLLSVIAFALFTPSNGSYLPGFLARPAMNSNWPMTFFVYLLGGCVVLAGHAEGVLTAMRQAIGSLLTGLVIIGAWWSQLTGTTMLLFEPSGGYRRTDLDFWLYWDHQYETIGPWSAFNNELLPDALLAAFLIVLAASVAFRLDRLAAVLLATLGPLAAVWLVWFVHSGFQARPMLVVAHVAPGGPLAAVASVMVAAMLTRCLMPRREAQDPGELVRA